MKEYITKDELHRRVCRNIKKYRVQAHLTQAELSEKIDMSHDYFRQLESEKGKKDFTFYTLFKIASTLKVSLDDFISE